MSAEHNEDRDAETRHRSANSSLYLNQDSAGRLSMGLLGVGGVGLILTFAGMAMEGTQKQAAYSYLVAFFFVATLALGGIFFTMLQHLVGAVWSVVVRRISETMAVMAVPVAVLAVPFLLIAPKILPWVSGPEANSPAVLAKQAYLNLPFFYIRAAVYLLSWAALGVVFYRRSLALDKTGDPQILLGLRKLAAPMMFVFGLTITFAGFDWMMSLAPEWYSTMFGVYIFAGTVVTCFITIALVAILLRRAGLLREVITIEHYHDLGKLTFAFIVFWAYIGFSQFFLIWYGNIPEETRYFASRWFVIEHGHIDLGATSSWAGVTVVLILFQFAVPFFTLLSRNAKRSPTFLAIAAAMLLPLHYLDLYWLAMPNLHEDGLAVSWLDVTALLGTVGVVSGLFVRRLSKAPLVPVKDPFLEASMEFENV